MHQHQAEENRANAAPLAPQHIAQPFAHLLTKRFANAQMDENDTNRVGSLLLMLNRQAVEDEDKVQAVKMLMFGAMTRQTFEWHPDRMLCKRMNLPDPFQGLTDINLGNQPACPISSACRT